MSDTTVLGYGELCRFFPSYFLFLIGLAKRSCFSPDASPPISFIVFCVAIFSLNDFSYPPYSSSPLMSCLFCPSQRHLSPFRPRGALLCFSSTIPPIPPPPSTASTFLSPFPDPDHTLDHSSSCLPLRPSPPTRNRSIGPFSSHFTSPGPPGDRFLASQSLCHSLFICDSKFFLPSAGLHDPPSSIPSFISFLDRRQNILPFPISPRKPPKRMAVFFDPSSAKYGSNTLHTYLQPFEAPRLYYHPAVLIFLRNS